MLVETLAASIRRLPLAPARTPCRARRESPGARYRTGEASRRTARTTAGARRTGPPGRAPRGARRCRSPCSRRSRSRDTVRQLHHQRVAGDLGDDGRGGDGGDLRVTPDDRSLAWGNAHRKSVDDDVIRRSSEAREGAAHGALERGAHADRVDLVGEHVGDRGADRDLEHPRRDLTAPGREKLLAVVEAVDVGPLGQHDRRRGQRARERTSPDLVDAGDDRESLPAQPVLERVQPSQPLALGLVGGDPRDCRVTELLDRDRGRRRTRRRVPGAVAALPRRTPT